MEYCGPVWQNASETVLRKLDTIQRRACKIIGKDSGVIPERNMHSLQHRRDVSALCQMHRMISGIAPENVIGLLPPYVEPNRISRYVVQNHHLQLNVSRSKTEHHRNSLVPRYSKLWNILPHKCIYNQRGELGSLQAFKVNVNCWLKSFRNA